MATQSQSLLQSPLYIIYQDTVAVTPNTFQFVPGSTKNLFFDIITGINHENIAEASIFPIEDGSAITDHVVVFPSDLKFTAMTTNSPLLSNPGAGELAIATLAALPYPLLAPRIQVNGPLIYPPEKEPFIGGIGAGLARIIDKISPLTRPEDNQPQPSGRVNRLLPPPGDQPLPTGQFPISANNRIQDMYNLLCLIQSQKQLVTIVTNEKTYFNMILLNIAAPRTADNGDGIEFSITSREIRRVSLAMVDSPVPKEVGASAVKSGGNAGTPKADDAATDAATDKIPPAGNTLIEDKNKSIKAKAADLAGG